MQEVEDMLQHPLSEEELKKAIEKHLGFEMPDKNWDEIKGAFYSEKEVEAFYRKQEEFVQYGSSRLQELIAQMAKTAMVDRIVVFWGEERKAIAV